MLGVLLALFLPLVASAAVLADEARTGRLAGRTARATHVRALVFLGATVAGGSLLVALPTTEWVFALALLPITALSGLRFAMLARGWWSGWRLTVFTAVLVGLGIAACLPLLPVPLSRRALIERLAPGRPAGMPDSIAPEPGFPVRA